MGQRPSGSSRSQEERNEPELGRRRAGTGRRSPESASHEKKHPWNPGATGAHRGHPHRSRTHDPTHTHTHTQDEQLTYTFDDRHWRVRGLEKQLSCERCT